MNAQRIVMPLVMGLSCILGTLGILLFVLGIENANPLANNILRFLTTHILYVIFVSLLSIAFILFVYIRNRRRK